MLAGRLTLFAPSSAATVWVISSPAEESLWPSSTSGTEATVTSRLSCRSGGRRTTPKPKAAASFSLSRRRCCCCVAPPLVPPLKTDFVCVCVCCGVLEQHYLTELQRLGLLSYTPSREVQGKRISSYDDR